MKPKTSNCRNSSSSKAVIAPNEIDVFLSFRGDLRNSFVSHLHSSLKIIGLNVYLDEKSMDKGEEINESLQIALVNSRICMPVFSKNYASSKACLLELSHMVQCNKKIIPIFYDARPDDVKLKTPLYNNDLEAHRNRVGIQEVERWKNALVTVARISGYDILNKNEAKEIKSITHDLFHKLKPKDQEVTHTLVQRNNEVECVETRLSLSTDGFRIVVIFGMGGIGKTTLAKVIFNKHSSSFHCCSFLVNATENLQSGKLTELQRQIYKDIVSLYHVDSICSSNDGINMIKQGLKNKELLLVLDDLDDVDQLTNLLGYHPYFTSASRLIITTRNEKVLDDLMRSHKIVLGYDLQGMNGDQALELFSRYAFKSKSPPEEFKKLSMEVVSYIDGLPLALEVFGSLLFGSSKDEWKGLLEQLKQCPGKSIRDRLMVSYNDLEINQRSIFLDIANYCGNLEKEYGRYMWDAMGWHAKSALKALNERSLIKITKNITGGEQLWMHDMLKDLGRYLVQDEATKMGRVPTRLRIDSSNSLEDLCKTKNKEHVETLSIHFPTITIRRKHLLGLHKLRFLELNVRGFQGDFDRLFSNLMWFCCSKVGGVNLINFHKRSLLVLELSLSSINPESEGWNTIKVNELKVLDLSSPVHKFSEHSQGDLVTAQQHPNWPDHKAPLITESLRPIDRRCQPLNFNRISNATNLEKLILRLDHPVTGLEEIGDLSRLWHLDLSDVIFGYSPRLPSGLLHLTLSYCKFVSGVLNVSKLKKLIFLKILSPENLNEIIGIEELHSLEVLVLEGLCDTKSMEISIRDVLSQGHLKNLKELNICRCDSLKMLLDMSSLIGLCSLRLLWCRNMKKIMSFNGLGSLTLLVIWECQSYVICPTFRQ